MGFPLSWSVVVAVVLLVVVVAHVLADRTIRAVAGLLWRSERQRQTQHADIGVAHLDGQHLEVVVGLTVCVSGRSHERCAQERASCGSRSYELFHDGSPDDKDEVTENEDAKTGIPDAVDVGNHLPAPIVLSTTKHLTPNVQFIPSGMIGDKNGLQCKDHWRIFWKNIYRTR
ncbi:hypothetical protein HNR23_005150 [Nocardiopsis mwathae]|uniref:Uncharacterized protein n=1 Tax=Nocardiopsis mwathae TaxID=1472723 RepID=A0A7W9YMU6_9ACTN|nr:hypothetical protein [Nocardiopsis mwathae]